MLGAALVLLLHGHGPRRCSFLMEIAMKPRRDTRARNLVFFITVVSALVVGLWLAR